MGCRLAGGLCCALNLCEYFRYPLFCSRLIDASFRRYLFGQIGAVCLWEISLPEGIGINECGFSSEYPNGTKYR